jgi:hypothetical protein
VKEHPSIARAIAQQPDLVAQFWGSFFTSTLLGGIGELFDLSGVVGVDLSGLMAASGGQLAEALNIANGWDPARTFATSHRVYSEPFLDTPQVRTAHGFALALEELLSRLLGSNVRIYQEVMLHGTTAHKEWVHRGSNPDFASGYDIVVIAGSVQQILAIEIDEPCDIYNRQPFHATPQQKAKDERKDADAAALGIPILRLSERQITTCTAACLGLALRLLDLYTPLDFPTEVYKRLDYRQVQPHPRYQQQTSTQEERAPRSWQPRLSHGWG